MKNVLSKAGLDVHKEKVLLALITPHSLRHRSICLKYIKHRWEPSPRIDRPLLGEQGLAYCTLSVDVYMPTMNIKIWITLKCHVV